MKIVDVLEMTVLLHGEVICHYNVKNTYLEILVSNTYRVCY